MAHLCVRDGAPGGRQSKREGLAAPAAGQGVAAGDEIVHSQAYPTSLSPGPASACWSRADIGHSAVNCASRQASGAPGLRASRG